MDASLVTNRPLVWLRRYLLAELVCTVAALLCAWLATVLTGSVAATAVAGTWGENCAFYGTMLERELASRNRVRSLPAILRDLAIEFGPATALDSLLLRPADVHRDGAGSQFSIRPDRGQARRRFHLLCAHNHQLRAARPPCTACNR